MSRESDGEANEGIDIRKDTMSRGWERNSEIC